MKKAWSWTSSHVEAMKPGLTPLPSSQILMFWFIISLGYLIQFHNVVGLQLTKLKDAITSMFEVVSST